MFTFSVNNVCAIIKNNISIKNSIKDKNQNPLKKKKKNQSINNFGWKKLKILLKFLVQEKRTFYIKKLKNL